MARLPRLALAGELHLVALRGHNAMPVFVDDTDRGDFLAMLQRSATDQRVALHAYVLLDNEARLLATPPQADALGRLMQSLGRRYVLAFNRRHGRRGTLWEGRFRSAVLEASTWLLRATVQIENRPVDLQLAAQAAEWRWSSAAHHLGRWRDPLVTEHPAYWAIGNTPFERESTHSRLLNQGLGSMTTQALDAALQRGHALGDGVFLARLAEATDRPLAPRPRGRPRSA